MATASTSSSVQTHSSIDIHSLVDELPFLSPERKISKAFLCVKELNDICPKNPSSRLDRSLPAWQILYNQRDVQVIRLFKANLRKCPSLINIPCCDTGLTCLQLAVITGRLRLVNFFLQEGANPFCRGNGLHWSAYDLALLQDPAIYQAIQRKRPYNRKSKKQRDMSFLAIHINRRRSLGWELSGSSLSALTYVDPKGKSSKLSAEIARNRLGIPYYSDDLVYPRSLNKFYVVPIKPEIPARKQHPYKDIMKVLQPFFCLRGWGVRLRVCHDPRLAKLMGPKGALRAQHCVRAGQDLSQGRILGLVSGMLTSELDSSWRGAFDEGGARESRFFIDLDQRSLTNWTTLLSEGGIPNVSVEEVYGLGGAPMRHVLMTANLGGGIKANEALVTCHPPSSVWMKWGRFAFIQDRRAIRDFYREHSVDKLVEQWEHHKKAYTTYFEQHGAHNLATFATYRAWDQRLIWPLMTPAALIDLACSNTVRPMDWLTIWNHQALTKEVEEYSYHFTWMLELIKLLQAFQEGVAKSPEVGKEMQRWVLARLELQTMTQMAHAIDRMTLTLGLYPKEQHRNRWRWLRRQLALNINGYDWRKDDGFVLEPAQECFMGPKELDRIKARAAAKSTRGFLAGLLGQTLKTFKEANPYHDYELVRGLSELMKSKEPEERTIANYMDFYERLTELRLVLTG